MVGAGEDHLVAAGGLDFDRDVVEGCVMPAAARAYATAIGLAVVDGVRGLHADVA